MSNLSSQRLSRAVALASLCTILAACDEQTASINEGSALRAASCALSPTALPILSKLAFDMENQAFENQANGSCARGGLISLSTVDGTSSIVADHCAYTDESGFDNTVNGRLSSTEISDNPFTVDWAFQSASLTQLISSEEIGQRVSGGVRFQHFESENSVSQVFAFDSLSWDDIEDTLASGVEYGETQQTIEQDKATAAVSFEYQSYIESCGFDVFALDVSTTEPLVQLETEFYPSSGMVEARAADGSSLSISLNGEMLAIDLDSNGDEVNDLQLSMSWGEFEGSTAVASRQRGEAPTRPTLILWPTPR